MAITPISIADLTTSIRYTLQDSGSSPRWTDQEIFEYMDEAVRDIAIRLKSFKQTDTFTVTTSVQEFTLNYEIISLEEVDTTLDWELLTNSTIEFGVPAEDTEVDIVYYAYPNRMTYGVDTTLDLDLDLRDEVKFYVLSRCYEKEDSTEYLNKAKYYVDRYSEALSRNSMRWHHDIDITLAKNDYYI